MIRFRVLFMVSSFVFHLVSFWPVPLTAQQERFRRCLSTSGAVLSYPSNETWWYDSQGVHAPKLSHPFAVAYATSTRAVAKLVQCAVMYHVTPVPRSGGHSYEAFSSGSDGELVIDLSLMNNVKVDHASRTADVDAGTRLGKLFYELSKHKLFFPAGDCTTVGLGGHVAGGGLGYVMRQYGVAADNILEMQFVDWRSQIYVVNERQHSDLFWALRGAGAGNFGVITKMKLKLQPHPKLTTGFYITWSQPVEISQLGKLWFKWKPWSTMPEELSLALLLIGHRLSISGYYLGSDGANGARKVFEKSGLLDFAGGGRFDNFSSPDYFKVQAWFANGHRLPFGDLRDYQPFNAAPAVLKSLELPPYPNLVYEAWLPIQNDSRVNATPSSDSPRSIGPIAGLKTARVGHVYNKYSSQMFIKEFNDDAYAALDKYLNQGNFMHWKPYGGFMKKLMEDKIAFPHRNVLFDAQYFTQYMVPGEDRPRTMQEKLDLYQNLMVALEPFSNHRSYQGYADLYWGTKPQQYMPRYFGGNVARLIRVKRTYDPHDFFSNEQSVPLYM